MSFKHIMICTLLLLFSPTAFGINQSSLSSQEYFHFGSWVAFGITVAAVLISWLMNHAAPKIRAIGTLLAALACFSLVIWFVGILDTGILYNPKPNQAPMDSAKPTLLWIQTIIALCAGLLLLMTAYSQRQSSEGAEDWWFVYFRDVGGST